MYHFHPIAFVEQMRRVHPTGCFCYNQGLVTIPCNGGGKELLDEHYKKLADDLGIEKEVMFAIAKQESKKSPFVRNDPKHAAILLERHYVYRLLKEKKDISKLIKDNPDLIYGSESETYGTYLQQINRLNKVKEWDEEVAIQSCSWGKFQIMGEYYKSGNIYKDYEEFEKAMNTCEIQHLKYLEIFLKEVKGVVIITAMKEKDWEKIAEKYNGKKWKKINPKYAENIEKFYLEFKN